MRTACKLLTQSRFIAKIDLYDAYFMLSITKEDRKYLRFHLNKTLYQFTVLPLLAYLQHLLYSLLMKPILLNLPTE